MLDYNNLGDEGTTIIATSLLQNYGLTVFCLSGNQIHTKSCVALATLLSNPHCLLTSLNLCKINHFNE